jgi:sugar lactone lactonase YvrE
VSDLRTRLDRLTDQLVAGAVVPDPAAIRHRGRRRQHRMVGLGLAALLVAGAAIPGVLWVRDRQDPLSGPRSVGREVAVITLPGSVPQGVAVGAGSVWVGGGVGRGVVYRIDPASNRVVATIPLTGAGVQDVAFGAGAVWAVSPGGQLARVDPASNRQVAFGYVDERAQTANVTVSGLRFGFGSLWVAVDERAVVRINPATGKGTRIAAPGAYGRTMAVGAGGVWVGKLRSTPTRQGAGAVMHIDPASNRVVGTVTTGAPWCCGVAAGDEDVWLAAPTSGTVARIDPATGRAVVTIRLGGRPAAVGVGGGSVWVADDQARLVWRIDARTNQVLGSVAVSGIVITQGTTWPVMEVTDDTLWVLHTSEAKISRIAPHR